MGLLNQDNFATIYHGIIKSPAKEICKTVDVTTFDIFKKVFKLLERSVEIFTVHCELGLLTCKKLFKVLSSDIEIIAPLLIKC